MEPSRVLFVEPSPHPYPLFLVSPKGREGCRLRDRLMIAPYGGGGRQKSEACTLCEESVERVIQDWESLRQECGQFVIAQ